jgi:hypothetical protein
MVGTWRALALGRTRRFAWYVLDVDPTSRVHVYGHFVAEPAVVVGYAGYHLHQVATLLAPAV